MDLVGIPLQSLQLFSSTFLQHKSSYGGSIAVTDSSNHTFHTVIINDSRSLMDGGGIYLARAILN